MTGALPPGQEKLVAGLWVWRQGAPFVGDPDRWRADVKCSCRWARTTEPGPSRLGAWLEAQELYDAHYEAAHG